MRAFCAVALSKPPFFMSSSSFCVLSSFVACAHVHSDSLHSTAQVVLTEGCHGRASAHWPQPPSCEGMCTSRAITCATNSRPLARRATGAGICCRVREMSGRDASGGRHAACIIIAVIPVGQLSPKPSASFLGP